MKAWKKKGALLSLAGVLLSGKTVYADSYPSSYQSWDAVGIAKTVFICSAVVVLGLLGFAIYRVVKEKSLSSKKKKLGFGLLALLSIIIVGANYAVNMFVNVIDTYFAPSYADAAKIADAELEDAGVDAALWIGGPGSTGLTGVANILAGEVNPSGRLVDTYAYDLESNPTYWNTGDFSYSNITYEKTPWGAKEPQIFNYKFVNYQEGIYLGYRYYETRFVDNATGQVDESAYDKVVQYPFGYGLSYTNFDQEITSMKEKGDKIEVNVKVTNTGDVAGKEVAQIYYTAPYTEGGVEKSHVVLAGFDKTEVLEPGKSEELTISFDRDDMASYDEKTEKAYVLDKGDYQIKLMNNAHDVLDSETYTVDSKEVLNQRSSDKAEVTNAFEYTVGDVNYVTRADWDGTLPTERTKDKEASEQIAAEVDRSNFCIDESSETPIDTVTTEDNGLRLVDLIGADYDDERWEQLVAQMSVDEMVNLVGFGGYATGAVKSIDKPAVVDLDGPAGINGIFQGIKGTQYNSEVVVASTWNTDLAEEMGDAFAKEALAHGIVGLYAPAVNIHRSPFSGRNFEYYSEDPLISGKMASSLVAKALENGVYTFTKHFALNDQEDNREGVATWSNEQAMREIYLKAFEIPVKEGGATAIMSSFNRIGTLWAGGNSDLLNTVLRDEWGFRGMVITDFDGQDYMSPDQAIRNGGDLMLTPVGDAPTATSTGTEEGVSALRQASKNILYTVAHSAAFDIYKPKIKWWIVALVASNIALIGLTGLGLVELTGKKKEEKEVA
ncbi:TPA: fibronectin type III-like domain-contianing protein [Streptococcus suis]|nr:fibronectin type III-like domain-contianing protein [Streptococcus suis]HEL2077343.1 fibronectin type III-like domain-contianing protein [Streptococcus suis]